MKKIGVISHYYDKIGVAIIELESTLASGDRIRIEGAHDAVEQAVESMQIEHEQVEKAKKGESVGVKVGEKVHEGSAVYKLE